jgi:PIN domain nuclease of toxin-antitoxin system
MRLLLDTHVWIWRLLEPERLSQRAEQALGRRENELFLSPISTWETLVLAKKGRIRLRPSPLEWVTDALRRSSLTAAPLTHEIALRSDRLEGFGSEDPADRFLVATALEHEFVLVTRDAAMRSFTAVATIW